MLNQNSKRFITEFLFWSSIIILAFVFASQYYYRSKVENLAEVESFSKNWTLLDSEGDVLLDSLTIPRDLRSEEIGKYKDWVFQKTVSKESIAGFNEPLLILGRIGDSDIAYFNDCQIGSTGYRDGQPWGWFWGKLRYYSIPKQCVKDGNNLVTVSVLKIGGPNYGIFGGPVGIAETREVINSLNNLEYLRFDVLAIFGIVCILVGLYYLFIYLLVSQRQHYGLFALLSVSVGFYELVVSAYPYRNYDSSTLIMKLNFLCAALTATFTILFLNYKFKVFSKTTLKVFVVVNTVLFFIGAIFSNFDSVYLIYENWFTVFILFYIAYFALFQINKKKFLDADRWRYQIGLSVFFVACIHDVVTTVIGLDNPYLVSYGFVVLMFTTTLTLTKEYADAFLYVEAQVSERTKELSDAITKLKELEKMKERFFANVSHDLKTPITVAVGAIEEAKGMVVETVQNILKPADRSLRRLQDMVTGILDTVKAEAGELELQWKSVNISEFVDEVLSTHRHICAKNGITLRFNPKGFQGLEVPIDPDKMARVFDNLLSNAIKYTRKTNRDQKVIEVLLNTEGSRLSVHVDDSGIGIPDGEHDKVFERYFQSSRTDLKEHGGSGIGLSFVKEMVDLHNGKIYASPSPLGGTRFTMEIPLTQSSETIQSYKVEDLSSGVIRGSLDVEYPPSRPKEINPALPTILTAEDNPEVAQIVHAALEGKYNIFFGENGEEALKVLKKEEEHFECVVSDISMPIMTGHDLVRAIRKEKKFKTIPVIMLSSHGDEETIIELLKSGANDYVTKPFRKEILLSRIQAQISAYKATTWNTKLEKLQELGQLVSGIGHQGKNRISRVGSNYPLLIKIAKDLAKKYEATSPDDGKRMREKVEALSDLIGKGYNQTLDLFRAIDRYASGSDKKSDISVKEVVDDTLTLLDEKIRMKGVEVKTEGIDPLYIEGYNEFREAILNIMANSVEAVKDGIGLIKIKGEDLGDELIISIEDNGMGVAKENIDHIFEPFFTTKQVGQGTGLGLYLARDAIELKNHGRLTIRSDGPGMGATFKIRIPKIVPEVIQKRPSMHNVGV